MTCRFVVGQQYERKDVQRALGVPEEQWGGKGKWGRGYVRHGDPQAWFIFATVGDAGRTGDDYENCWEGDEFVWCGTHTSHAGQPTVKELIENRRDVYVFTRGGDRDPFVFQGLGTAVEHWGSKPIWIRWRLRDPRGEHPFPEELPSRAEGGTTTIYVEGTATRITVNRYERSSSARRACVAANGVDCIGCGFNFGRVYGERGEGFIHVHHVVPLSQVTERYRLDPAKDLQPVCPNCHAMIHRYDPPLSIAQLRKLLGR